MAQISRKKPREQSTSQQRRLLAILLGIYLLLLTWSILFKAATSFTDIQWGMYRRINLIPFHGSPIVNGQIQLNELVLNLVAFFPVGVYLQLIWREKANFLGKLAIVVGISLSYEVLQYLLGIGATDITDVLMNSCGGLLGLVCYQGLAKLFGRRIDTWLTGLAVVATLLLVLFLAILIGSNS